MNSFTQVAIVTNITNNIHDCPINKYSLNHEQPLAVEASSPDPKMDLSSVLEKLRTVEDLCVIVNKNKRMSQFYDVGSLPCS